MLRLLSNLNTSIMHSEWAMTGWEVSSAFWRHLNLHGSPWAVQPGKVYLWESAPVWSQTRGRPSSHTRISSATTCQPEAHTRQQHVILVRPRVPQKEGVKLTMADLASFANTNWPIRSFSSRWMQRAANSHSERLGVHDPQRKAQRTEPMSAHRCPGSATSLLAG